MGSSLAKPGRKTRSEAHTVHGHKGGPNGRTPTYVSWMNMKARCRGKRERDAKNYSDRGISYDPRWESFESFLADMGPCPKGLTLERKDSNLGYSKSNCIWADRTVQGNNKRNNVLFTHDGLTLTQQQWAERLGISRRTIINRRKQGLPVEKLLAPATRGPKIGSKHRPTNDATTGLLRIA